MRFTVCIGELRTMKKINDYPLTKEEFKSWLLSKKPGEFVGYQHSSRSCPIFYCLNQKGVKAVSVLSSYIMLDDQSDLTNPTWVTEFINNVDSLSLDYSRVTAKKALEVL